MQIIPYLNFDGQCEQAFRFYQQCLGGEITAMLSIGETPAAAEFPTDQHARIMHASLHAGEMILMGADSPSGQHVPPQGLYVSLHPSSALEAERIFEALAQDGTVTMPLQQTFWATRFGMLVDQFGIPWMLNCSEGEGCSAP